MQTKVKEAPLVSVSEVIRSGSMNRDSKVAEQTNRATQLGSNVTVIMQALQEIESQLKTLRQRVTALEATK
jgi:hypothetical protein